MDKSEIKIIETPIPCIISKSYLVKKSKKKIDNLYQTITQLIGKEDNHVVQFININKLSSKYFPISIDLAYTIAKTNGDNILYIDTSIDGKVIKKFVKECNKPYQIISVNVDNIHLLHLPSYKNEKPLNTKKINSIISNLRSKYNLIVIDSNSPLDNPEIINFSINSDGVVLVLEAAKTRIPVANKVKDKLEQMNVNIIGLVLNNRRLYIPKFLYSLLFKTS